MRTRILLAGLAACLALVAMPASALPPGSPEGSLVWTPGVPVENRDVSFGVSARDPDGVIISVRIDFGDGTFVNLATPPRSTLKDATACAFGDAYYGSVKHRYAKSGSYQAKLTIVGGSCPLSGAVQDASVIRDYELRVVQASAGPADAAAMPVGGLRGPAR